MSDVVNLARKYSALVALDVDDDMPALVERNAALSISKIIGVEREYCDAEKCMSLAFDYLYHNEKRKYARDVMGPLKVKARRCARLNGFFVREVEKVVL